MGVSAILIFAGFLVTIAYFAFFETVWNGQTPGKRWTHLRVMMDSGRPVDVQSAILRNLMRIVDTLPSLYAVGIVTSLISAQNKRIGDYLAGTVVVHEKPLQAGQSLWQVSAAPMLVMAPAREVTREFHLVEAFLERRDTFAADVAGPPPGRLPNVSANAWDRHYRLKHSANPRNSSKPLQNSSATPDAFDSGANSQARCRNTSNVVFKN